MLFRSQRNYEWTEEQCEVFFKDILRTYDKNISGKNSEHFIGSVTYFKTETAFGQPNKLILIDGQQRITTTMLFLIALRDLLTKKSLKDHIDNKYLKNNEVAGDGEYKIKLKQVETDWQTYKKLIFSDVIDEADKKSSVYQNYKFFYGKIQKVQASGILLEDLIEKGLSKFSIITIELEPQKNEWEDPQEIFESMNSLGKPLSLADLVRNYLMLGLSAKKQDDYYKKYWMNIEKILPKQISNFLRDYMQACDMRPYLKAKEANYKELYYSFKLLFCNKVLPDNTIEKLDVENLISDLSKKAVIYSYIINNVSTGNEKVDLIMKDFRYISISTAYSFILVLLSKWKQGIFNDEDIENLLEALRIYCFRRRILGITSSENKNFPILTQKIDYLETCTNKKEGMFEILSSQENNSRLPNDIELIRCFDTLNFYNFSYCKLYLAMIEESITKSRPDLSDKNLQIEHIMPQTLNDKWKSEFDSNADELHQQYVHNLGNLTLIRHNQELGQKTFENKKEIYNNKAGLQIAKTMITSKDKWDINAIIERKGWLTKVLLYDVLPIPNERRKSNNFSLKNKPSNFFLDLDLIGKTIYFIDDPKITATVIGNKEVLFEEKKWKLSPLTREIGRASGRERV